MTRRRITNILGLMVVVLPTSVSCGEPLFSPQLWGTFTDEVRPQGAGFVGNDRIILVYPCKETCDRSIIVRNIETIQSTKEKKRNTDTESNNIVYVDPQGVRTPTIMHNNEILSPRVSQDMYNATLFSFNKSISNPKLKRNIIINTGFKGADSFKSFNAIDEAPHIVSIRKFSDCAYLIQESDLGNAEEAIFPKTICPRTNAKDIPRTRGIEVDAVSGFIAFNIYNLNTRTTTSIAFGNNYNEDIPIVSEIFGNVADMLVVRDTVIVQHRSPANAVSLPGKTNFKDLDKAETNSFVDSYTLIDRKGVAKTVQSHKPYSPHVSSILKYCLISRPDKHSEFEPTLKFIEKYLNYRPMIKNEEYLSSSKDGQLAAFRSGKTIRVYRYNSSYCRKTIK